MINPLRKPGSTTIEMNPAVSSMADRVYRGTDGVASSDMRPIMDG